jgi:DNA-binding transcriptional ArsR family regulator
MFMAGEYTQLPSLRYFANLRNMERVFMALADATRRQILRDLQEGELPAGEIASRFTLSAPAVSRHLSILQAAGLLSARREANRIYYRLEAEPLAETLASFAAGVCPNELVKHLKRSTGRTRS